MIQSRDLFDLWEGLNMCDDFRMALKEADSVCCYARLCVSCIYIVLDDFKRLAMRCRQERFLT